MTNLWAPQKGCFFARIMRRFLHLHGENWHEPWPKVGVTHPLVNLLFGPGFFLTTLARSRRTVFTIDWMVDLASFSSLASCPKDLGLSGSVCSLKMRSRNSGVNVFLLRPGMVGQRK